MIKRKVILDRRCIYQNIDDYPDVKEAEEEQIGSQPSLIKQNYGWVSLGGAFIILSIALIFLLIRSMESVALMVSTIVITFIVGVLLISIPMALSRYRLCSVQLVELAGRNVYDEFDFLTTDNTLDKALENSFGKEFFFKLTNKKELEVLTGRKDTLKFTTYDFSAECSSISTLPNTLEGTLIRVRCDTGVKTPTYAISSSLSDFFAPLEKLSIGGDGFTYFGNSKEDLEKNIDLKTLLDLDPTVAVSITSTGLNILLFGKTVDIRKIRRGDINQERYEQVVSNFDVLTYILNTIKLK